MKGVLFLALLRVLNHDPEARGALLSDQAAALSYEASQRAWWPVATLDSPGLAAAQGNEKASSLSTSLTGSLVQKLPGGGSLTAGSTQNWTRPVAVPEGGSKNTTSATGFTLALDQPLAGGGDRAELERRLASVALKKTLRDRFLSLLGRAAALDIARATDTTMRTEAQAADGQQKLVAALQAQGRATAAESWKAARTADTARWDRDRAALNLESLSSAWAASGGDPQEWALEQVEEFYQFLETLPDAEDLEDRLEAVTLELADQDSDLVQRAGAPRLLASAGAQKPDSQPWTYSAQLGLSLSSDSLFGLPLLKQRDEKKRARLQVESAGAASSRALQRQQRTALLTKTTSYLLLVEEQELRQAQTVTETIALVSSGVLTEADLSAALAASSSLAETRRKTLWDLILLKAQNVRLP